MRAVRKLVTLLSLLPRHPREFLDRLDIIVRARLERSHAEPAIYEAVELGAAIAALEKRFAGPAAIMAEPALRRVEEDVRVRLQPNGAVDMFAACHNADLSLAQCCYVATRVFRPRRVVETGVAHGVTSAFVLAALEANGSGVLESIDLPPLHALSRHLVGAAIPDRLRTRWRLHLGSSKRLLPNLIAQAPVDIFIHDSLHTYAHMHWEFETVWAKLPTGGVIISDDVQDNRAWHDLVDRGVSFQCVIREEGKRAACALAVK